MTRRVGKAFAYVTRGTDLLVFSHVGMPEAGIQVPAVTIDPGETPADAVLRETEQAARSVAAAAPLVPTEHSGLSTLESSSPACAMFASARQIASEFPGVHVRESSPRKAICTSRCVDRRSRLKPRTEAFDNAAW